MPENFLVLIRDYEAIQENTYQRSIDFHTKITLFVVSK